MTWWLIVLCCIGYCAAAVVTAFAFARWSDISYEPLAIGPMALVWPLAAACIAILAVAWTLGRAGQWLDEWWL